MITAAGLFLLLAGEANLHNGKATALRDGMAQKKIPHV